MSTKGQAADLRPHAATLVACGFEVVDQKDVEQLFDALARSAALWMHVKRSVWPSAARLRRARCCQLF